MFWNIKMGKGSKKRKTQVSEEEFQNNWDKIFNGKTRANTVRAVVRDVEFIEQKDNEVKTRKGVEPSLNNVRCIWWDCGWCYHSAIDTPHACPGVLHCDVDLKI